MLEKTLFTLHNVPITPLAIGKFLIIFLLTFVIAKGVRSSVQKLGKKSDRLSREAAAILSRILYYSILFIGILLAAASIGFDLTALAVIGGVLSVWIGISLKGIFHNFVCGLIVLLSRVIHLDEVLELPSGEVGVVTDITLWSTVLTNQAGTQLFLPNTEFIGKKFISRSRDSHSRRVTLPFALPLSKISAGIEETILKTVQEIPYALSTPSPEIWTSGYTTSNGEPALSATLSVFVGEEALMMPDAACQSDFFRKLHESLTGS